MVTLEDDICSGSGFGMRAVGRDLTEWSSTTAPTFSELSGRAITHARNLDVSIPYFMVISVSDPPPKTRQEDHPVHALGARGSRSGALRRSARRLRDFSTRPQGSSRVCRAPPSGSLTSSHPAGFSPRPANGSTRLSRLARTRFGRAGFLQGRKHHHLSGTVVDRALRAERAQPHLLPSAGWPCGSEDAQ